MRNMLLIGFLLVSCLSYTQTRNLKTVKAPVENPTTERRKAVVIGMSDYGEGKSLNNTLNDAEDMVHVLTLLGFEVTLLTNNDLRNLETNLTTWYKTIERNDMAIFYFAGHGVEVGGSNYLIPINAELNSESDVRYNALNVNKVLDNMDEKQVRFKLLILDACRDNPFTRGWNRSSNEKGLAHISAPKGTLIAFAAAPGATAADGGTYNLRNGVFTHFLKQEILTEGASIDNILNRVAGNVAKLTDDRQLPYKTGMLTEDFYFKPGMRDRPGQVVVTDKPAEPVKPVTQQTYYYYIDKDGNKSANRFDDFKSAESELLTMKIFGRIYSSDSEEVLAIVTHGEPITPPAQPTEPNKTVTTAKRNGEIWNPDGIEMIFVQGGTFTMGCTSEQGNDCNDFEKPSHQVTVGDFYIGKYEVTQAQWKAVMGTTLREQRDKADTAWPLAGEGDNYPMYYVSWDEAMEFIRRLNAQTGKQYRLPTEAEWEFAARGGVGSRGYKYSGGNTAGNVAWYYENAGEKMLDDNTWSYDKSVSNNNKTHPVGTKSSNELGIYDMSGNVWEWCNDWYGGYNINAQTNPQGPSSGSRVKRGGSWSNIVEDVRVSYRGNRAPAHRFDDHGFRLVCSSK